MTRGTRRAKWWLLVFTVIVAAVVVVSTAWHGKKWVRQWTTAPTPAQDVANELARYSREEKAFGRRGPVFEQVLLKLSMHGLKWSEAEVVQGLGTPDGMFRDPSGDLLLYTYGADAPGDRFAIVQLVNGAVSDIGYNSISELGKETWAPYQPPPSPEDSSTRNPPDSGAAKPGEETAP